MFTEISARQLWGDEHIEMRSINSLESVENERGNNERLMPTGIELSDKNFYISLWAYLQTYSRCNHADGFRYISKKNLSPSKIVDYISNLSRKGTNKYINKPLSRPTVIKGIKYFKEREYILEEVDGEIIQKELKGKKYYRIQNENVFKYYVLLENEFLKTLLSTLSQDAFRVYLIYYSFNEYNEMGKCFLPQEEILRRVGLSSSGKNFEKLRHINTILRACGLIEQEYQITRNFDGVEIKRNLITKAPLYWNTKLYTEVVKSLENKEILDETIIEYVKI